MLVKRTIRCNGHLHEIGLTSKGQLWIPSHTKAELEGFKMMEDLGNNPCKCAVVYDAWQHGQFTHTQIHELIGREKIVRDRLANRLARHIHKDIQWPNIDVVYGVKRKLKDPTEKGYNAWENREVDVMAEYVTETVYLTLISRGFSSKILHKSPRATNIYYHANPIDSYGGDNIFCANVSGHGYISIMIGGNTVPTLTLYGDSPDGRIPWRVIIDATEAYLLSLIIREKQNDRLKEARKEFCNIAARNIERLSPMPKHAKINVDQDNGTVTLTITHPNLTIQTANRLIHHYRAEDGKVQQLLKYNRKRIKAPHRYPLKPSRGLGALAPKRETDTKLDPRSVEHETYDVGDN